MGHGVQRMSFNATDPAVAQIMLVLSIIETLKDSNMAIRPVTNVKFLSINDYNNLFSILN